MLKIIDAFGPYVKVLVGDGRTTSFFYDKWLSNEALSQRINIGVNVWGSSTLVHEWRREGVWSIPPSFCRRQPIIAAEIQAIQLQEHNNDRTIWTLTLNGKFTIASFYEKLRMKRNRVHWHRLVWAGKSPQKYRFIMWLLVQSRLKTRELLQTKGMNIPTDCVLCDNGVDSCNHLFFQCQYSKLIWKKVLALVGIHWNLHTWNLELQWLRLRCKGRSRISKLIHLSLLCTVYSIWMERNARIFSQQSKDVNGLFSTLTSTINLIK